MIKTSGINVNADNFSSEFCYVQAKKIIKI